MFFPCQGITRRKMYLWKLILVAKKTFYERTLKARKSCRNKNYNFGRYHFRSDVVFCFTYFRWVGKKGRRCLISKFIRLQQKSINLSFFSTNDLPKCEKFFRDHGVQKTPDQIVPASWSIWLCSTFWCLGIYGREKLCHQNSIFVMIPLRFQRWESTMCYKFVTSEDNVQFYCDP